MKRLILALILLIALFSSGEATNYYMKPGGTGDGSSIVSAVGTFQAIHWKMVAGDTLFVLGGAYTAQNYWINGTFGTTPHPIVVKAWGDAVADFQQGTQLDPGDWHMFEFYGASSGGWVVFDGESHLAPGSTRYFKITAPCHRLVEILPDPGFHWRGLTFRGIEFDGQLSESYDRGYSLFAADFCDSLTIDNCWFHHAHHATGDAQEAGELIFLRSCEYVKITDNVFQYANHGLLDLQARVLSTGPLVLDHPCRYIQITGNDFNNGWGGGLYLNFGTNYCLVDQNIFRHSGATTSYPKPPIQLSGPHNTIRRNVFYNPLNQGMVVNAQVMVGGEGVSCDGNYIYNNTFYHNKWYNMTLFVTNGTGGDALCSLKHCHVINNLFYDANGPFITDSAYHLDIELRLETYWANTANDWIESGRTFPDSGYWAGTEFKNNLYRHNGRGIANDSMIYYTRPPAFGSPTEIFGNESGRSVRITTLQSTEGNKVAWKKNISGDPKLASLSPDTYGDNWWYTTTGSACRDSGIAVVDSNGIWMHNNHPGAYEWGNLATYGTAPDIGAYEFPAGETTPICTVTPTTLSFGTWAIADTSDVQTFKIKNTGSVTFVGTVSEASPYFDLVSGYGPYSLTVGDSIIVTVRFVPSIGGALTGTIETGQSVCSDVTCSGGGCTLTPSTIAFGNVEVGDCSSIQTLTLTNTGTGTITGTISETSDDFAIISGDGAYSLTAGQSRVIYVRFCPLSTGAKICTINF